MGLTVPPLLPATVAGTTDDSRPKTDEEEDEAMEIVDNSSRQRVWRTTYAKERKDPEWTAQMVVEVRKQALEILDNRKLTIQNLSCHKTICRMYLQFEDQLDAQAFQTIKRPATYQYEFQNMDPEFKGEGFDRTNHTYEVMVQRSPQKDNSVHGQVEHAPSEASDDSEEAEDESEIIVSAFQ
jgi:hypothetical protein